MSNRGYPMMDIADFLGTHSSHILTSEPFKNWCFKRSVDEDLEEPIIHYVFRENGMELRCDQSEWISVIFLFSDEFGGFDDSLLDVSFSDSRQQILERFGYPSKSGGGNEHPILGYYGLWDRYMMNGYAVHFEYKKGAGSIDKITYIREDVIP